MARLGQYSSSARVERGAGRRAYRVDGIVMEDEETTRAKFSVLYYLSLQVLQELNRPRPPHSDARDTEMTQEGHRESLVELREDWDGFRKSQPSLCSLNNPLKSESKVRYVKMILLTIYRTPPANETTQCSMQTKFSTPKNRRAREIILGGDGGGSHIDASTMSKRE